MIRVRIDDKGTLLPVHGVTVDTGGNGYQAVLDLGELMGELRKVARSGVQTHNARVTILVPGFPPMRGAATIGSYGYYGVTVRTWGQLVCSGRRLGVPEAVYALTGRDHHAEAAKAEKARDRAWKSPLKAGV